MSPLWYRTLIQAFLDKAMPPAQFEGQYLRAFKTEPGGMQRDLYLILEELFEAVDAYWEECSPEEETKYTISEHTLREKAQQALDALDGLLPRLESR